MSGELIVISSDKDDDDVIVIEDSPFSAIKTPRRGGFPPSSPFLASARRNSGNSSQLQSSPLTESVSISVLNIRQRMSFKSSTRPSFSLDRHRVRSVSPDPVSSDPDALFDSLLGENLRGREFFLSSSQPDDFGSDSHRVSLENSRPLKARKTVSTSDSSKLDFINHEKVSKPRAAQKKVSEAEKLVLKEQKLLQKQKAAEEKAKQQILDKLNRKRQDTSLTVAEMIVQMPEKLHETALGNSIKEILSPLGVEFEAGPGSHRLFHRILFQRKVTSHYNVEEDLYVPIALSIEKENQSIVFLTAEDLAGVILSGPGEVKKLADEIKGADSSSSSIILIEGLMTYLRKSRALVSRQVATRIRQMNSDGAQSSANKTNTNAGSHSVELDQFNDIFADWQILHSLRIIHTSSTADTAEWLCSLIKNLSLKPYKKSKLLSSERFDIGRVKCGSTAKEVLEESFGHIKYVSPGTAKSIANTFRNFQHIHQQLQAQGPSAFEGISKDGQSKSRSIGASLAQQIHTIFTSKSANQIL